MNISETQRQTFETIKPHKHLKFPENGSLREDATAKPYKGLKKIHRILTLSRNRCSICCFHESFMEY